MQGLDVPELLPLGITTQEGLRTVLSEQGATHPACREEGNARRNRREMRLSHNRGYKHLANRF